MAFLLFHGAAALTGFTFGFLFFVTAQSSGGFLKATFCLVRSAFGLVLGAALALFATHDCPFPLGYFVLIIMPIWIQSKQTVSFLSHPARNRGRYMLKEG